MSFLTHLECSRTGTRYAPEELHNLSEVGAPLLARYDLIAAADALRVENLPSRRTDMWRYREIMPAEESEIISLGEGFTPLRRTPALGRELNLQQLCVKDESLNPTGSFKARGLSAAVTAAAARGARALAIPTAGNAGGALAAYAAAAGIEAHVFMPVDTPLAFQIECRSYGASLELVDGLINDCGALVAARKMEAGWFDVSTLKEPYRVEGKKTMGYELWEQFGGKLPDAILYPTGGGTGLIGMWKAFQELIEMGLYKGSLPRMCAVQSTGCAPIVHAFKTNQDRATAWQNADTIAPGIRIPTPFADDLILAALKDSGGGAVEVTDEHIKLAMKTMSRVEGIDACPEGAATFAALDQLMLQSEIYSDEDVVLFTTGTGLKHPELR